MSAQLPTPTEADGAALFEAAESGRAELCVVDEAEMRAIGFVPVGRGVEVTPCAAAEAPWDDPVVLAAAGRLVARGLALPESSDRWAAQASGPLLAWFAGHVLPEHPSFVVDVARTPGEQARGRRRVTVVGPSGMTMVEYLEVPAGAGPDPLPVRIDAVRSDVLVEELVGEAFAPVPEGEQRTITLLTTVAHGPARVVADHEVVGLHTTGHGLRRQTTRTRRVDEAGLRHYVEDMLHTLVR